MASCPRPVGLVSKSGTFTYQLMGELSDIGFTACLGAGGDPIVGTTLLEALEAFEADPATKAVIMIGEIGGIAEQDAAAWAYEHMTKPVVAYIAGFTAPEGKQMGHAGAIVSGGKGTAQDKKKRLRRLASVWAVPRARPLKSCVRCSPGHIADRFRRIGESVLAKGCGEPSRGASMTIYAVALGCYMALMFWSSLWKRAADNLTAVTNLLTEAVGASQPRDRV